MWGRYLERVRASPTPVTPSIKLYRPLPAGPSITDSCGPIIVD